MFARNDVPSLGLSLMIIVQRVKIKVFDMPAESSK